MLVVSIGCPASIGPEVSVAAASKLRGKRVVLVGSARAIQRAAKLVGVEREHFEVYQGQALATNRLYIADAGPVLSARDLEPGTPTKAAGRSQLDAINAACELVKRLPQAALVTGPVNKAAIARSGAPQAELFHGHTEWLQRLDDAKSAIMCFASQRITTSLVTTHVRLRDVAAQLDAAGVSEASVQLGLFLERLGSVRPRVAVCSLNPHAGEDELLGDEERLTIVPGIALARKRLGKRVELVGPIGAESAYRRANAGDFAGVVAMYHDQATIPTKLVAFGHAVNVTLGLSFVRTSVDHGTAYDIAWRGKADIRGMLAAMRLAERLVAGSR